MKPSGSTIASTAIIYPEVELGDNCIIEDYCIVGCPSDPGIQKKTIIGNNAHLRAFTVIYDGNTIGKNFRTGNKANIREANTIGDNVSIGTLSVVEHHVLIGNGVRVHSQAFIPEYSELHHGSWIGPNVALTNSRYPLSNGAKENLRGPIVKENAKIGANATLLPGITVGENSLVGAGSVVCKDVASDTIVAGNPAAAIRSTKQIYT